MKKGSLSLSALSTTLQSINHPQHSKEKETLERKHVKTQKYVHEIIVIFPVVCVHCDAVLYVHKMSFA
jgi:hypothetical protein